MLKVLFAVALLIPIALAKLYGKMDLLGIAAMTVYWIGAVATYRGLVYPGTWLRPDDDS